MGKSKFVFFILLNAPLKVKMNKELGKTTNKNKTISIKNYILNDFLSEMVVKRLMWMFSSFLQERKLKL